MPSGDQLPESMPDSAEAAWKSIYHGALEKNEAKVRSALSHATLTILNNEGRSPVYQLAYDATIESIAALHFLLGKFLSSSMAIQREMLRGFLAHHHLYHAKALLQTEENPVLKWLLTKSFVMYCARFEHNEEVEKIFNAASPTEQHYLLPIIAEGYARNHNNTALVQLWENNPDEHFNLLMAMTCGICSRGGKITELETLWSSINFLERKILLEKAVANYTKFRHLDSAKSLLIENDEHRFSLSSYIMRNLFLPNDFDLAKDLLERAESSREKINLYETMVQAAIGAGNVAIAKWLLLPNIFNVLTNLNLTAEIQSKLSEMLAKTYMSKWHIESAKTIIAEEQDQIKKLSLIKGNILVCALVGNIEEIKPLLKNALEIDRSSIDKKFIARVVADYIILGLESETNHLHSIVMLPMINTFFANNQEYIQLIEQISHDPNGDRMLTLVDQENLADPNAADNLRSQLINQSLGTPANRQAAINLLEIRALYYPTYMLNFEINKLGGYEATGRMAEIRNTINQIVPGEGNVNTRFKLFAKSARALTYYGFVDQALQLRPTNQYPVEQDYFDQGIATVHLLAGDFEKVLDYVRNAVSPEQFLKELTTDIFENRASKGNSALFILGIFKPLEQKIIAEEAATQLGLDLNPLLPRSMQLNNYMQLHPFHMSHLSKLRESWPQANNFLIGAGPYFFEKLNAKFVAYLLTFLAPMSERQSWKFLEEYCESASRPRVRAIMDQEPKSNANEEKKPGSGFKLR